MKKIMILSAVAVLAALFTSCGGDKVSLTPSTLEFTATDATTKNLTIKADGAWTIKTDKGWIHVSDTIGTGAASLTVYVNDNANTDARSGYITLSCNGVQAMCRVDQSGLETQVRWFSNLPTSGMTAVVLKDQDNDFVTGVNSANDLGKFEQLTMPVNGTLKSISFIASRSVAATGTVKVRVYDVNKTNVLAEKEVNVSTFINLPEGTNVSDDYYTDITLTTPLPVAKNATYYVGVEWDAAFSTANENKFAIFANYTNNTGKNTAYEKTSDNTWGDIAGNWGITDISNINLWIVAGVETSELTRGTSAKRPTAIATTKSVVSSKK